jgi:hypothetical protein
MMKLIIPNRIGLHSTKRLMKKNYTVLWQVLIPVARLHAGESLGKQVAAIFAARARGDRAGKAIGDATVLEKLTNLQQKGTILGEFGNTKKATDAAIIFKSASVFV